MFVQAKYTLVINVAVAPIMPIDAMTIAMAHTYSASRLFKMCFTIPL